MQRFDDPPRMPGTGESARDRLARSLPLSGTPGEVYVARRGVPLEVAAAAEVRFDPDFGGRPAVLVAMVDRDGALASLHGRYLHAARGENKMLTIGTGGGVVSVRGGWRAEPLIVVEGLFDALSLAACGWASVATVGRWAHWLPEVSAGRTVWLAFDTGRPGDAAAALYAGRLVGAECRRLPPPPRCKDWSTALVKRGQGTVARWVRDRMAEGGAAPPLAARVPYRTSRR
jgi:Toprim-like